jgi:hypothetical protein
LLGALPGRCVARDGGGGGRGENRWGSEILGDETRRERLSLREGSYWCDREVIVRVCASMRVRVRACVRACARVCVYVRKCFLVSV